MESIRRWAVAAAFLWVALMGQGAAAKSKVGS